MGGATVAERERIWDRFLTDQDKASLELIAHKDPGTRPALIMASMWPGSSARSPAAV